MKWLASKRLWKWLGGGVVAVVLLVCLLFRPVVRMIIRHEIIAQVGGLLNAKLELGDLQYHPLLGLTITHATLSSDDGSGNPVTVAELGGLDVNLAKLPLGGPILIDHVILTDPVVHLTRLPTGDFEIQPNLLRPQPASAPTPSGAPFKFSQAVQVRHLELKNLIVDVTDQSQTGNPTATWASLNVTADLASGGARYAVHLALLDKPLADVSIDAAMDLDQYQLSLKNFTVSGSVPGDRALQQLPPAVQTLCRDYGLVGGSGQLAVASGMTISIDPSTGDCKIRGLSGDVKFTPANSSQSITGRIAINNGVAPPASGYDFSAAVNAKPLGDLAVEGSLDLDHPTLALKTFTVNGQIASNQTLRRFPPSFRQFCRQYKLIGASGTLTLASGLAVSLDPVTKQWTIRNFSGDLKLSNPSAGRNVNSHFAIDPVGDMPAKSYVFSGTFNDDPLADLALGGTLDLSQESLVLKTFSLKALIPDDQSLEQLPPPVQAVCRKNDLVGGSGELTLASGLKIWLDPKSDQWKIQNLSGDVELSSVNSSQNFSGHVTLNNGTSLPAAGYDFTADVRDKVLAQASVEGTADPDRNLLSLKRLTVNGTIPDDHTLQQLSPQAESICRQYGFVGGSGELTLADGLVLARDEATRQWTIRNLNADWKLSSADLSKNLSGHVSLNNGSSIPASAYVFRTTLSNKPLADVSLDGAIDLDRQSLSLSGVSFKGQIPDEQALEQLPPGAQKLCRQYGLVGGSGELVFASGLTLSLDRTTNRWKLSGMTGNLTLSSQNPTQTISGRVAINANAGGPMPTAANPIGLDYLNKLDPDTALSIEIDPQQKVSIVSPNVPQPITDGSGKIEYHDRAVTIHNFGVNYGGQPLNVQGTLTALNDRLSLSGLHLNVASGSVQIDNAEIRYAEPHRFKVTVAFDGIDLKSVRNILLIDDPQGRISGIAGGNVNASGVLTDAGEVPLDQIVGDGSVHAENGDFFSLPILGDVAGKVNPGFQGVGQVGSAAAVFTANSGTLFLSKLAASCPLVGAQGYGNIGMISPNPVDMHLIVTPLGDWQQTADQTNIPFFGRIAGKVQNVFSKVSQNLYNFHVTGPVTKPSVQPEAAPALKADAQNVFGQMVNSVQGNLLKVIKPNDQKENSDNNK